MRFGRRSRVGDLLDVRSDKSPAGFSLEDGDRIGVIGGGPAGSFFSYFLLGMAEAVDLQVELDIYEPRHFSHSGPAGCNHCGGIISESLVQILAAEGIRLPSSVIRRGIDSYVVHMDEGSVRIESPVQEQRIASVFRGNGPRGGGSLPGQSFDDYLLQMAVERGAHLVRKLVDGIDRIDGRLRVAHPGGEGSTYDLIALAVGVNSNLPQLVGGLGSGPPIRTTRTYICEFPAAEHSVERALGGSMHVFLPSLPRVEFAALVPKGDYVTLVVLGEEIDQELIADFLTSPAVRRCFPGEASPVACHCTPLINIRGPGRPFADRLVLIGDCGVTRLYKDGIGAAYRTGKAAAETAIFHGVSARDFERHYQPACRAIEADNTIGKLIFGAAHLFKLSAFSRRGVLRMTAREQSGMGPKRMSGVLWNLFTGSAAYREILMHTLHPAFGSRLFWHLAAAIHPTRNAEPNKGGEHAQGGSRQVVH